MNQILSKTTILIYLSLMPFVGYCQTLTATTTGTWTTGGTWDSNPNYPDLITEDVQINNGINVTHNGTEALTTGDVSMANNSILTLNSTGTIDVGENGDPKNLTAEDDIRIDIGANATLTVWGDMTIGTSGDIVVTGTLIISGDFVLEDGAQITVDGDIIVMGDLDLGATNSITINGSITVSGAASTTGDTSVGGSGTITASSCTEAGIGNFCTFTVLPVELLSFEAKTSNGVLLQWSTASEKNNSHFEVQRSYDGRNYEVIGTVTGAGNSFTVLNYDYHDDIDYTGLLYYRLKQVDFSGVYEVFNPLSIELNNNTSNVTFLLEQESISIKHSIGTIETFQLELYNIQGKQLFSTSHLDNNVVNLESINLYEGIYIIKAQINNLPFVQKVPY